MDKEILATKKCQSPGYEAIHGETDTSPSS